MDKKFLFVFGIIFFLVLINSISAVSLITVASNININSTSTTMAYSPITNSLFVVDGMNINEYDSNTLNFKRIFLNLNGTSYSFFDCNGNPYNVVNFHHISAIVLNPITDIMYVSFNNFPSDANENSFLISSFDLNQNGLNSLGITFPLPYCVYPSASQIIINKLLVDGLNNNIFVLGSFKSSSSSKFQDFYLNLSSTLSYGSPNSEFLNKFVLKNISLNSGGFSSAFYDNNGSIYSCGVYFDVNSRQHAQFDKINVFNNTFYDGFSYPKLDYGCNSLVEDSDGYLFANLPLLQNGEISNIVKFSPSNNFNSATVLKEITGRYSRLGIYNNIIFAGLEGNDLGTGGDEFYLLNNSLNQGIADYVFLPQTNSTVFNFLFGNNLYLLSANSSDKWRIDSLSTFDIFNPINFYYFDINNTNQQNNQTNPTSQNSFITSLADYFLMLFPPSSSLTTSQKFGFVFLTMFLCSILIYFLAWKSTNKINGIVHYLVLITNVLLFFLFTGLGYIPIGVIVVIVLILIVIAIFRIKGGN